ncbi:kinesin motor domain-containing protein [Purpureocillium lavendulum]|uniref:Kinesin-like protein n=1 Tax=Purpureocillium lavendulum TaxID=1247861 RepID=A0AB34FNT4_9HYPO|nr:kinesin motor domain-containing protein [Purpureocillium lavendulum]
MHQSRVFKHGFASALCTMEEFYLANADRFRALLQRTKLETPRQPAGTIPASRDVTVVARIRPLGADEGGFPEAIFARQKTEDTIDAHELRKAVRGPPVLKAIYDDVVRDLVPWAWGGGISTLFAYGQTGSGKTYSISGLEKLVAQAIMGGSLEGERKVYVSIVELAGNSSFGESNLAQPPRDRSGIDPIATPDLLNQRKPVSILEDAFGVTQIAGALERHIQSASQLLAFIESATEFRRTEATARNDASSRSHAICRLRIEIPSMPTAEDGMFYLIDLAGSEGARDKQDHGVERMREARAINISLSVLKDCIRGKAEHDAVTGISGNTKRKPHVPFRQNQLTKVLKHVFDPSGTRSCKTIVLTCVNPCLADIQPSRNALRFAELLRVFVPTGKGTSYDVNSPATWSNEQLRKWIDENLLKLPGPEFEMRCMKTKGVTPEQATAFRSKLWQTHIDAQHSRSKGPSRGGAAAGSTQFPESTNELLRFVSVADRSTSLEPQAEIRSLDFKKRIRPGMVVAWSHPDSYYIGSVDGLSVAMILCPAAFAGNHGTVDARGDLIKADDAGNADANGQPARFLCAIITPAILPGAYDVNMWRQVSIDVDWMDKEILLEYDSATRFYYIAV